MRAAKFRSIRLDKTLAHASTFAKRFTLGNSNLHFTNAKGERLIWLDAAVVNRLRALRDRRRELQRPDPAPHRT